MKRGEWREREVQSKKVMVDGSVYIVRRTPRGKDGWRVEVFEAATDHADRCPFPALGGTEWGRIGSQPYPEEIASVAEYTTPGMALRAGFDAAARARADSIARVAFPDAAGHGPPPAAGLFDESMPDRMRRGSGR